MKNKSAPRNLKLSVFIASAAANALKIAKRRRPKGARNTTTMHQVIHFQFIL